jgi:hypothetical protein
VEGKEHIEKTALELKQIQQELKELTIVATRLTGPRDISWVQVAVL